MTLDQEACAGRQTPGIVGYGKCLWCGKRFAMLTSRHDCCSAKCMWKAVARLREPRANAKTP